MPAVKLNDLPADGLYAGAKQDALIKLWLIITTDLYVSSQATKICATTIDADQYAQSQQDSEITTYYLDLEALAVNFAQVFARPTDVVNLVFQQIQSSSQRSQYAAMASNFSGLGKSIAEYGPGGCLAIPDIMNVQGPPPPLADEAKVANRK